MLFVEMLDVAYEDSMSIIRTCEIDFGNPPVEPEPLIKINDVTVGSPGNIMCVAGSEGAENQLSWRNPLREHQTTRVRH